MGEQRWWWCLVHGRAESAPDVTGADRLGPYGSEAEAARALERVERRNEAWEDDPRWRDPD